jgi:hypothetical protein
MRVEKSNLVAMLLEAGAIEPDDVNKRRTRDQLEKTVSRRWADLVDRWRS